MVQKNEQTIATLSPATTDTGRVRIGGGMISFDDNKVRDEIKDAGRTKIGGGMIQF
jgi:hypothetical protein